MVGLKRRRKVEGWAIDTSDLENSGMYTSTWQRLAENNKLWIASLAFVVIVTGFCIKYSNRGPAVDKTPANEATAATGSYDDSAHTGLVSEFANQKSNKSIVIEARFLALDKLELVVASTTSADDIEAVSKRLAIKANNKFKGRPVVLVYTKNAADNGRALAATTQWNADQYGFVVKFKNSESEAK